MRAKIQQNLLLIILLLVVLALCVLAAVPPVSRDALTHHLLLPKLYLAHGGIYEIPEIPFSYYPMNLDYIYMFGMWLVNDIVPTYVHMLFGLLTALLILVYLRRRYSLTWGLLGALFFLTLPVITRLSITTYVDLGMVFFVFASLLCLLKWRDNGAKLSWLIIGAVMCGLAMGTKYNGFVDLFVLTAFVPVLYSGMKRLQFLANNSDSKPKHQLNDNIKALAFGVFFALIALIVFSPWAIKNYVWTQNPVYPLAQGLFNSDDQSVKGRTGNEAANSDIPILQKRQIFYGETLTQTLLVPLRVFFDGKDDQPQFYDGRLNPALLIFSVIAMVFIRKRAIKYKVHDLAFISYAAIILLLVFFLVDMRIRYISTIIPPMVVLTVVGIHSLLQFIKERQLGSQRFMEMAVMVIVAVAFLGNFAYMAEKFRDVEPFSYLSGQVSREQYLTRRLYEYPTLKYLNANVPKGTGIFAVFIGNRMYYSDHFLTMDFNLFFDYVSQAASAAELANQFEYDGYGYFLFNATLMNQFAPQFLGPQDLMRLDTFIQEYCERIYKEQDYILYRLRQFEIIDSENALQ